MPWMMLICGCKGPAPSSKGTAMPSLPPRTTKEPSAASTPAPAAPAAAEPAPAEPKQQPPAAQQTQTGNTMPWSAAQQGAPNGAQNGGDGLPNGTGASAGGRAPPSANGGAIARSAPGAGGTPPGGNQGTSLSSSFPVRNLCVYVLAMQRLDWLTLGCWNQECY